MNYENLNKEKEKSEAERLAELMTRPKPVMVMGSDFMACNFGDEAQNYVEAGRDSVVSGKSGSAVYDRETGKWRLTDPYMKIVNASHLPDETERVNIDLKFDDFRKLIE